MSIGKDPIFREQYAGGGGGYSSDVEAALNGSYEEELPPHLKAIAERRKQEQQTQSEFSGPAVKLR